MPEIGALEGERLGDLELGELLGWLDIGAFEGESLGDWLGFEVVGEEDGEPVGAPTLQYASHEAKPGHDVTLE